VRGDRDIKSAYDDHMTELRWLRAAGSQTRDARFSVRGAQMI
jgi:hypothetical protein